MNGLTRDTWYDHTIFRLPSINIDNLRFAPELVGEAFAICFTAFAISFAMAKILADKHNYTVDANQVRVLDTSGDGLLLVFTLERLHVCRFIDS